MRSRGAQTSAKASWCSRLALVLCPNKVSPVPKGQQRRAMENTHPSRGGGGRGSSPAAAGTALPFPSAVLTAAGEVAWFSGGWVPGFLAPPVGGAPRSGDWSRLALLSTSNALRWADEIQWLGSYSRASAGDRRGLSAQSGSSFSAVGVNAVNGTLLRLPPGTKP